MGGFLNPILATINLRIHINGQFIFSVKTLSGFTKKTPGDVRFGVNFDFFFVINHPKMKKMKTFRILRVGIGCLLPIN